MSTNTDHKTVRNLFIATLGVVYGDIGTSPLYTMKECFSFTHMPMQDVNILGICSLIFWSLMLVVSYKYIVLILRADNNGEGGILALTALALRRTSPNVGSWLLILGLVGASMFYGDSAITPAISVMAALEGLHVADPNLHIAVMPLSIVILLALFFAQSKGTKKLGQYFGPTVFLWFVTIGLLGLYQVIQTPRILIALNPAYAVLFLYHFKLLGFIILSAVVLCVTGAEALYADMGHFTRESIRVSWFVLVFPCLALNYFGQGALLMENPEAIENPFYHMVPAWGLYPMIVLATAATIIASQAVISGMFSMTWQAVQLGFLPRMRVIHTSAYHFGQVYVPSINIIMMILTILAVLIFQGTDQLASAYGLTVTVIMVITTTLTTFLALKQWNWALPKIVLIFGILVFVDLGFLMANSVKFLEGGWFPVLISTGFMAIMTTWKKGRETLIRKAQRSEQTIPEFVKSLKKLHIVRVPGTAVFLSGTPDILPNSLKIHIKHNKTLHEKIFFLSIVTEDIPRVPPKDKIVLKKISADAFQIIAYYGFMEIPDIPLIFEKVKEKGVSIDLSETSFFLSRGIPVTTVESDLSKWREKLFIFLAHNATNATEFFKIPIGRVIELGIRFKV